MPRLKAATDANGVKFYPTTITHGVYDTDRNQKLTATLDNFETTGVNALNLLAILTYASSNSETSLITNPEWKFIFVDSENRILFGKKQDNTWYFGMSTDDILDFIIKNYVVETTASTSSVNSASEELALQDEQQNIEEEETSE